MMYGAVELGDVMLFFVGIHGLTGLEVYARLGWHFDGVCDTGILATGLHEVLVGLFGHLWHCVSPLLCSNSSTEQVDVYSRFSVMIGLRLHLTGRSVSKRFFMKKFSRSVSICQPMVADLVGQ